MQKPQDTWVLSLGGGDALEKSRQPIPVFLPGGPTDRGAWWAMAHRVTESQT